MQQQHERREPRRGWIEHDALVDEGALPEEAPGRAGTRNRFKDVLTSAIGYEITPSIGLVDGIRIGIETLPPFLMAGGRFVVAGLALMLWSRARGTPLPTPREWLGVAGVGACLVLLSNVPIVWAERHIASGVVALFAASSPLMIAFFNGRRTGTSLGRRRALGKRPGTAPADGRIRGSHYDRLPRNGGAHLGPGYPV